ncbi:MAG: glycerophosphodiester phosphodiesterase [Ornithinimicrobium sp.]
MRLKTTLLSFVTSAAVGVTGVALSLAPASAGDHVGMDRSDHGRHRSAEPIVIGHRGAAGYRPEHTLASYELAARMGADCIEPDLVSTSDGVLVARHENEISGTTDVAQRPEFADREATKVIDGLEVTGWFTEDFTLAELKTLRAVERLPQTRQENTIFDGRFEVPTLDEVLALRARLSKELHRDICVYIETKHPTYFDGLGLSLEEPLVSALTKAHLNRRSAPVFIQSFELANLSELDNDLKVKVPLVFLIFDGTPYDLVAAGDPRTVQDLITAESLQRLSTDIDGIGPAKEQVIVPAADGSLGEPTSLVQDAHAAGLVVHPYTFRAENEFLPTDLRLGEDLTDFGLLPEEITAYLEVGIDGFFTDQPDIGVFARDAFVARD